MKKRPTSNKPTPKPLPSADAQRERMSYTRYVCAVWWPVGGYGDIRCFKTLDEARRYAESLAPMGYPKWRQSQVHVWKETTDLIDVIDASNQESRESEDGMGGGGEK